MAKVKRNVIIEGLSGRIGNLVFKQYGDKTVVCKLPEHNPNRVPTPGEQRQRDRIKEAASMAKSVLATKDGRAYYQAARKRLGKHSAYHAAVYDFFETPEVIGVQVGDGGELLIQVQDNVGVQEVRVMIDGESGLAEPLEDAPCSLWQYPVNGNSPWVVQVWAEDWMGNVGTWKQAIEK